MTQKIGMVFLVLILVTVAYLFMIIVMPWLAEVVSTTNTTIAATSNMSNYPGLSEGLLGAPLFLYFVPGGAGIFVVILILKSGVGEGG